MEAEKIKKQIIKDVITPFFKNNSFTKKGVKFFKNINALVIEAEIQSQRYYTEENVKNFRIDVRVFPNDDSNYTSRSVLFGYCTIMFPETSWITINENTNFEELKIRLENELSKVLLVVEESSNLDLMIEKGKNAIKELEKSILKNNSELEKESDNQNLIHVLKNQLKTFNAKIEVINNWLNAVNNNAL